MFSLPRNLRVVTLECPYDSWDDPAVRALFIKVISLKLAGYGKEYPYGALPVDAGDFIGNHQLICEENENGELLPLMGFKDVSLERSRIHRITFPALALLQSSPSDTRVHQSALNKILSRCEQNQIPIAYGSSWTMDPRLRGDKEFSHWMRGILTAMIVNYYRSYGFSEYLACGVMRFKTDQYFNWFGYKPLDIQVNLPPFQLASLQGEMTTIHHCTSPSEAAQAQARMHQGLWNNRLVMGTGGAGHQVEVSIASRVEELAGSLVPRKKAA